MPSNPPYRLVLDRGNDPSADSGLDPQRLGVPVALRRKARRHEQEVAQPGPLEVRFVGVLVCVLVYVGV